MKTAVISTFLVGLASQGMGLFNKFSVHDDPANYGVGVTFSSGRWMLDFAGQLEGKLFGDYHYSLPAFNGILAFFFIAAAACLIIRLLQIRNPVFCAFIGGIMVAFPVITSMFGYMFTFHFYMLGMLLGVSGAFLACSGRNWLHRLAGIALMGSSIGVYQAFLPVNMCVVLLSMLHTVTEEKDKKTALEKAGISGLCGILSVLFYAAVNTLVLRIKHIALSGYKGINAAGTLSFGEYLNQTAAAYREFFYPNPGEDGYWYVMVPFRLRYIYYLVIAFSIVLSIIMLCRMFKKDRTRAVILLVLTCLFPLCVNFIFVMAGKENPHSLMMYAQIFPFIYFAWILERTEWRDNTTEKIAAFACSAVMILTVAMYCRIDNKCYLQASYAQQQAISYFTTLITRIKSTEGYADELPVAWLNENQIHDTTVTAEKRFDTTRYLPYAFDASGYINDWNWKNFMAQWCGFSPTLAEGQSFEAMDEVISMPHYPDDGSIKVIDGTVVVNF